MGILVSALHQMLQLAQHAMTARHGLRTMCANISEMLEWIALVLISAKATGSAWSTSLSIPIHTARARSRTTSDPPPDDTESGARYALLDPSVCRTRSGAGNNVLSLSSCSGTGTSSVPYSAVTRVSATGRWRQMASFATSMEM